MSRGGRPKDNDEPERKCIATGEVQPKGGLIRFVVGPSGQIAPDVAGKVPGRGIYVAASKSALEKAIKKGLFARSAKQSVQLPDDLIEMVETVLARRITDLISLSRKSGEAVAGYEKVKSWLVTDQAQVLIQASDGSDRGKSKLRLPGNAESFVGCLTQNELGLAFGRDSVIHAALLAGGLTSRIVEEAARLSGVREIGGGRSTARGK